VESIISFDQLWSFFGLVKKCSSLDGPNYHIVLNNSKILQKSKFWPIVKVANLTKFTFDQPTLQYLKYRYFGGKSTKTLENVYISALNMAILQNFGLRADFGFPWLFSLQSVWVKNTRNLNQNLIVND
jgi:hypothetical protein